MSVSLRTTVLTKQALVCLDHDQVLVEVIVPGNQVKAVSGGRTTEGDVTHKENLGQSTVQLENMSQKTDNQEFTRRPIAIARLIHNVNLQTYNYFVIKENVRNTLSDTTAKKNMG